MTWVYNIWSIKLSVELNIITCSESHTDDINQA